MRYILNMIVTVLSAIVEMYVYM